DTMFGGIGNDAYIVDSLGDTITEFAGEGIDSVETDIDYTLPNHVENLATFFGISEDLAFTGNALNNLILGGAGNDTLTGLDGNDELNGGEGADTIDGGAGADTMRGGNGDDTFFVDDAGDTILEGQLADGGSDIVYTSITYDVPTNVEVLIMLGSDDIDATGTEDRDQIFGNDGVNIINGGLGFDVMAGGAGNDVYSVDNSLDAVIEEVGGGFDNVFSSVDYIIDSAQEIESAILVEGSATVLRGDDSGNQLFGNSNINVIDGRGGTDFMLGGGGADIFQINLEPGAVDVVGDFSKAEGDRMAFTGFNQATTFVNQASATSFEVRDTKGTATLDDDTVQTFQLWDSYDPANPQWTQGSLVFNVDYYFG
ncbi:MAG: calcium-binding protein, partial [Pseudomonadota bacterium]